MGLALMDLAKPDPDETGVCVELSHGRRGPELDMKQWGTSGPILGPFPSVHVEYNGPLRIVRANNDITFISTSGGLIYYDGVYYGNWVITAVSAISKKDRDRLKPFSEAKHKIPKAEQRRVAGLQWYVYEDDAGDDRPFCSVKKRNGKQRPVLGPVSHDRAKFEVARLRYERNANEGTATE